MNGREASSPPETPATLSPRERAFDRAPIGLVVVDASGRVRELNAAAEAISGRPRSDGLGMPAEWVLGLEPGYLEREVLWSIATAGQWAGQFGFIRNDGGLGVAEASAVRLADSPSAQGREILIAVRDVSREHAARTNREDLEVKLLRAADEWQRTIDAIDVGVLVLDPAGRVRRLNRAALDLLSGEFRDHIGRHVSDLGTAAPWRCAAELVAQVDPGAGAGQIGVAESAGFAVSLNATELEEGGPRAFVLVVRRRLDAAPNPSADGAEALLRRLFGGLAHDLRNPLFAISAAVGGLRQRSDASPLERELYEALGEDIDGMAETLRDLEEYAAERQVVLVEGHLDQLAARAVREVSAAASQRGVAIHTRLEPTPALLDPLLAQRMLTLALQEAIASTPEGGRVDLDCLVVSDLPLGDRARCVVRDSGRTPRPDDLARAFEPYFLRRRPRQGLALTLVHSLAKAQRGSASAEGRPPGGLAVVIELPSGSRDSPA